jgi:two-component system, chemotaxis family, sensor kinase CheA
MDLSKYATLFLAESREHLSACDRLLLEWEREPASTRQVGGLFRAIHTVKGMAATMGYAGVADLAHRLENLLDALRRRAAAPSAQEFQLLFRSLDALAGGVEAAVGGASSPADEGLAGELDAAASALGGAPTTTAEHAVPARPSGAFLAAREDARPIQVVLRRAAVMRGARAALVLQRAEILGAVSAVRPAPSHFDSQDFDGRFAFRLATAASEAEIEAALRAAGEVESVGFEADDAEGQSAAHGRQIRVDLGRLDTLMKQVGELVVAKNRLGALAAESPDPDLAEVSDRIARLASEMQAEVIAARMTPVGEVLERFPRVVRDLARDLGKRIRFDVEGGEIELDRSILDEIGPPLLHLIRNAADHGIESPEERIRAGKPEEGRLLLSASRDRNSVALRLSDDGRGIDRERILAKARREGVIDAGAEALGDDVLLRVLARPGFSTAESVSGVSGRGVGVDVAVTKVRALGGTIEVRSELGKGTTFTIRVPLTLAIVRALLASAAGERYAVPLAYVAETVEFDPRSVTAVRDREALLVRDQVIPTVHLRDLVRRQPRPARPKAPTVILEIGERRAALVVDALVGQQDIVVEPFDAPREMPSFVGGATILADGSPAIILDAAALV